MTNWHGETAVGGTVEWYTPPEFFERLGMTTVIEHVRHRVAPGVEHWGGPPFSTRTVVMHRTACGRPFIGIRESTRDTRRHEPATSRCPGCHR